jgi:putative ABC transport system permease protein
MTGSVQEIRYVVRGLRRNPGFTIAVVVTLGICIGVNTAVFSILESILLRPLPFRNADHLVAIWSVPKDQTRTRISASGPEFEDYKHESRSLERLASVIPHFTYTWTGQGEPKTVNCTGVSFDLFPMLGVQPVLGRLYAPEEYQVDGVNVVISQRFWKEQLGEDPGVIGRVLNLDGTPQTIIGVVPPIPDLFPDTDIWAKIVPTFRWMQVRGNRFLMLLGQLKPGVTRDQAAAELTTILHRESGESQDASVRVISLKDELVGGVRTELELVTGAVALVLMIGLVNVAYLLLARSWRRQSDVALRLCIGASRARIARQLIAENIALAAMGGGLGLSLAVVAVRLFVWLSNLPRNQVIRIDSGVLWFAITLVVATGSLLAWAPAAMFSRLEPVSILKAGLTQLGMTHKGRLRLLLISEVTLTVVLMVGTGLLLRSFWNAQHIDPGFQPDRLLTAYLRTNDYAAGRTFFPSLLERTATLPGVRETALSDCVPAASARQASLSFDDRPSDPNNVPLVQACWISSDYFRAIGTALIKGRSFTLHDDLGGPPVVIVNNAFVHAFWPRQSALGKRVSANYVGAGRNIESSNLFREVVGVVADIKQVGLDVPAEPAIYMPYLQDSTNHVFAGLNLFVKTSGDPRASAGTVRAEIYGIRANQPITSMQTMDDVLFQTLSPRRLSLALFGSFAAIALCLSAIGIYGMIAYTSNQRIREMGMRVALGAQRNDILWLVLKEGLLPAATGVVLGALISSFATKAMSALLFGVTTEDPLTFATACVALLAVAAAACLLPARRAARVDPMVALRYE